MSCYFFILSSYWKPIEAFISALLGNNLSRSEIKPGVLGPGWKFKKVFGGGGLELKRVGATNSKKMDLKICFDDLLGSMSG
jgi:hypothetical protein